MESINESLEDGKIYYGVTRINQEYNFVYFRKLNDELVFDIIRKQNLNINSLVSVCNIFNQNHFKCTQYKFKNFPNFNFKDDEITLNLLSNSRTIRFFGLKDETDIHSNDKQVLENVIKKLVKYFKRYLKDKISYYEEQIKKYDNVLDVLSVIPEEIYSKFEPFWIQDYLKNNEKFNEFKVFPIVVLFWCNELNIKALRAFDEKIVERIIIMEKINLFNRYKETILNTLKERISFAEETLKKEKQQAIDQNDQDLIYEINIIEEELEKQKDIVYTKANVENLEVKYIDFEWWPDVLYPRPNIDEIEEKKNYINHLIELNYKIINNEIISFIP